MFAVWNNIQLPLELPCQSRSLVSEFFIRNYYQSYSQECLFVKIRLKYIIFNTVSSKNRLHFSLRAIHLSNAFRRNILIRQSHLDKNTKEIRTANEVNNRMKVLLAGHGVKAPS